MQMTTLHAAVKTLDKLELILNNDVECVIKSCKQNRMVANRQNQIYAYHNIPESDKTS